MFNNQAAGASQELIVMNHLYKAGSISGVEAAALYKIRSLPRRIKTLRDQGYKIESKQCRDVTGQRYVRYHFPTQNHPNKGVTYHA